MKCLDLNIKKSHNLGKFDVVFIIKTLLEHNELNNNENYKLLKL